MIYHIKQPLMIVGFILLLILSSNALCADETPLAPENTPQANITPSNTAAEAVNQAPIIQDTVTAEIIKQAPLTQKPIPAKAVNQAPVTSEKTTPKADTQAPVVNDVIAPVAETSVKLPVNEPKTEAQTVSAKSTQESVENESKSLNVPTEVEGLELPQGAQSTIIPTSKATDVRVIIDISGSMKQNDPDNLRIPALNLIVEMVPEGARAGVWTFGQWVNMLIPPAIVDQKWRDVAKKSAQKINSHGLRTNMGEAMEQAMWQLESDGKYEQHAILLTDGLVDIAPDNDPQQQAKNSAERQRIATDILKKYQALGVKIHSIGLSNNADKVLLDKLALETGGSSVVVNTPEELVKAFLKAFEKAAPEVAEQVPLAQDNTFDIDASVEEFTALVFRKKDSAPMQLTSPSGVVISQIKGAGNARWFGESVYDLVTITKPEAGKWKIEAELDTDNRVTVVSDLKMGIKNLPNALFPGQQVNFEVFLHEDGKVINNPDFLKLMTIEMTMTAESGRSGTKVISDPENLPADGRYQESISRLSKEGQYELKIEVDGKTFKRMRKDYIQVRQPIGFEIRKIQLDKAQAYAVRVIPQVAEVEVAKTRVIAKLKGPDQSSIIQAMPWIEEGVWEAVIDSSKGPGDYVVTMNIKGTIGESQEFRVKPDPITLTFPIPEDFTHEYLVQSEQQEVTEQEPTAAQTPAEKPEETVEEITEEKAEVEPQNDIAEKTDAVEEIAEPVMPNLDEKMKQQAEEVIEEAAAEAQNTEEIIDDMFEPMPYWLYAAIPAGVLFLGIGGFLIFRKSTSKKSGPSAKAEKSSSEDDKLDVSLNDGLDDGDFDEDFDLSGDDDDEMAINVSDDDGDSGEDAGAFPEMDDLDDMADDPEPQNAGAAAPVEDDIPDFDENFDVENSDEAENETASAIDDLDSVLDSLSDEDEENIPKLDKTISEEDDSSIDAALANLESELDDIDVDALIDDGKKD